MAYIYPFRYADEALKRAIWNKGTPIAGYDPNCGGAMSPDTPSNTRNTAHRAISGGKSITSGRKQKAARMTLAICNRCGGQTIEARATAILGRPDARHARYLSAA